MHQEALTDKGREIFPKLKDFSDYYLTGGTSLALQIGHRISVDFDFFSPEDIPSNLLSKVKHVFDKLSIEALVNNPDELTIFADDVKVSFIKYPFPVLFALINIEGIQALSAKEIGATKAYTIGRRGSFKDYVDIFFILKEKLSSLNEIIDIADRKYKNEFNGRLFLEQLTYAEDVKDTSIILLRNKNLTKDLIFNFFAEEIKKVKI